MASCIARATITAPGARVKETLSERQSGLPMLKEELACAISGVFCGKKKRNLFAVPFVWRISASILGS